MIEKIQPIFAAYAVRPLECRAFDPRSGEVAQRVTAQVAFHAPALRLEHIGSSAVPGCAGTGTIDLLLALPTAEWTAAEGSLIDLGFNAEEPPSEFFTETRLFAGSIAHDDRMWPLHVYLVTADSPIIESVRFLRTCLRSDPDLKKAYVEQKRNSLKKNLDPQEYNNAKSEFLKMILG